MTGSRRSRDLRHLRIITGVFCRHEPTRERMGHGGAVVVAPLVVSGGLEQCRTARSRDLRSSSSLNRRPSPVVAQARSAWGSQALTFTPPQRRTRALGMRPPLLVRRVCRTRLGLRPLRLSQRGCVSCEELRRAGFRLSRDVR